MIVSGDAAATARHILASAPMYRQGVAADLIAGVCYVGVTAILYGLLRPVSRTLSLAAAFFSLAGCAIGAVATVSLLIPLALLGGAPYGAAFRPDQLQSLVTISLELHGQGYNIGMIFFGIYCALLGCLVFRSTFFPRFLGVLLALAGAAWLTDSFATILSPAFESRLDPYIEAPGFIGETALMLWLLAVGVNAPKWKERVGAAGEYRS